jgi:hypothetical protein
MRKPCILSMHDDLLLLVAKHASPNLRAFRLVCKRLAALGAQCVVKATIELKRAVRVRDFEMRASSFRSISTRAETLIVSRATPWQLNKLLWSPDWKFSTVVIEQTITIAHFRIIAKAVPFVENLALIATELNTEWCALMKGLAKLKTVIVDSFGIKNPSAAFKNVTAIKLIDTAARDLICDNHWTPNPAINCIEFQLGGSWCLRPPIGLMKCAPSLRALVVEGRVPLIRTWDWSGFMLLSDLVLTIKKVKVSELMTSIAPISTLTRLCLGADDLFVECNINHLISCRPTQLELRLEDKKVSDIFEAHFVDVSGCRVLLGNVRVLSIGFVGNRKGTASVCRFLTELPHAAPKLAELYLRFSTHRKNSPRVVKAFGGLGHLKKISYNSYFNDNSFNESIRCSIRELLPNVTISKDLYCRR